MSSATSPSLSMSERVWLVLAATGFAALDVLMAQLNPPTTGWAGPHAVLLLQLPLDASLVLLIRFPRLVMSLVMVGAVAMLTSDLFVPGLFVPTSTVNLMTVPTITPCVLSLLPRMVDRRQVLLITAVLATIAGRVWHPSWSVTPFGLLTTVLPAVGSLYLQARRELLQSLRDRAERAEREQHLVAERARDDERRRLAGEMHDVVTHRLSLMVLHAGALSVTSKEPSVRDAAEGIRFEGTRALDELRDLVGVLRGEERDGSPAGGMLALGIDSPDPATLAAESESVGIPVRMRVDGAPDSLSPTVARTAYRVVQEALTNVRKHAPGSEVDLELRYRPEGIDIRVSNTAGLGVPDPILAGSGSGAGLIGLRQRVELIGGTLQAGPLNSGGYQVSAILPAYVPTTEGAGHDPRCRGR